MFYNVLKAKDIVDLGEEKFKHEILMQDNDNSLSVIEIKIPFDKNLKRLKFINFIYLIKKRALVY